MSSPELDEIFQVEAELEYIQASEFYRNKSPELGRQFIDAFQDVMADIRLFPEMAVQVHPVGIRRIRMKKFPYSVLYILEPDAIFIVAVAHHNRQPEYWLRRLSEPGRD